MQTLTIILRNSAVQATSILLGISLLMSGCIPDFLVSNPDWVVIEAGDHESLPKRKVGVLFSPTEVSATVTFDSSCIYDIGKVDGLPRRAGVVKDRRDAEQFGGCAAVKAPEKRRRAHKGGVGLAARERVRLPPQRPGKARLVNQRDPQA